MGAAEAFLATIPFLPGFDIISELGHGGMGVVYKAWQFSLKRMVALKMIRSGRAASQREIERFRTEAMAVARLHHPNLVPIYEIGDHCGQPYFVMEFMDGGTLSRRMDAGPWIRASRPSSSRSWPGRSIMPTSRRSSIAI